MTKLLFSLEDKLFDIRRDAVFKAVFTKETQESRGALSKLVFALIRRELNIVSVLANEPPVTNINDRQIRYDINCRANNGELIIVEMCFSPQSYEIKRFEYYLAKLVSGQELKGGDINFNDCKEAYQIAILANKRLFPDEHYYHRFRFYDEERHTDYGGCTRIITLELAKLGEIVEKPIEEMTDSDKWAIFFEYLTSKEKRDIINEIIDKEEGISMASQVLITVSEDEEERARLLRDEKIEMDYRSGLSEAKREGQAEGKQIIIELLKSGKSPEEIIKEYGSI